MLTVSAASLQVHVNPSQSVLVLEGDDIESFNRAVQQVTYRNSLRFATPGVRPLKLTTSLRYQKHTNAGASNQELQKAGGRCDAELIKGGLCLLSDKKCCGRKRPD